MLWLLKFWLTASLVPSPPGKQPEDLRHQLPFTPHTSWVQTSWVCGHWLTLLCAQTPPLGLTVSCSWLLATSCLAWIASSSLAWPIPLEMAHVFWSSLVSRCLWVAHRQRWSWNNSLTPEVKLNTLKEDLKSLLMPANYSYTPTTNLINSAPIEHLNDQ